MGLYRIIIGNRELDIQADSLEEACAAAGREYPGELITGFYPIPQIEENPSENSEGGNDVG